MLTNEVYDFLGSSSVKLTGHVYSEVFTSKAYAAQPAMPLLVMFWFFLFTILFRNLLYKVITRFFPRIRVGELEIDEDLDNYFHTLDEHDRNWSIKEEENARENLKMKILENETLEKLRTTKMGDGHMKGVHCYDILANPLYLDDFQYFSASMEDRELFIIDDDEDEGNDNAQSDLVKIILNLAFLTEEKAKEFTFSKAACGGPADTKGKGIN